MLAELFSKQIFANHTIPLRAWIAAAVDWLYTNHRPFFQAIKMPVEWMLNGINGGLHGVPPILMLLLLFVLAWWAAGWRIGLFSVVALGFVGFLGLWGDTMTTLAMVISAVVFCVIVGVPLGILASRSDGFATFLRPILDVMQTTPAFVYLVPVVMLFSIGTVAGVIATIVFSMPPLIRLTNLGIRQVQGDVVEAATAFGSNPREILFKVQLPLALPTIMAGLNQTIMLSLSMVVIAALIGAGGLGLPVFEGLNSLKTGLAGIGGLAIVLLAMVLDRITQGLGERGRQS
ncbi:MAG TPA: proline/glycine betaine ABC transporter permease [Trueperaceae bacterium]|nr:proline/glycine betaine ABC transporter permease [Trueperaceae bacterium]